MNREPVGSLADEAAKLMAVLQGWSSSVAPDREASPGTAGTECAGCPVCRLRRAVSAIRPEVRAEFSAAGTSIARGLAGLLADLDAVSRRNGAGGAGGARAASATPAASPQSSAGPTED